MARKTNKELLEKQKDDMITVGQLRKLLEEYPDDLPIGVIGHFGEVLPVYKDCCSKENGYITPDAFWHNTTREYIEILCIETPDLGEDPY